MDHCPTEDDARVALHAHLVECANEARLRHGLYIDFDTFKRILDDRKVVRYPTQLVFDADPLEPGQFAHAEQIGERPSEGFRLSIHPYFKSQPDVIPLLAAYHIAPINYGDIAAEPECELFGATLVGLDVEAYYQALCELADSIP